MGRGRYGVPPLDNYVPEPNSGCWLWLGRTLKGYGITTVLVGDKWRNGRAHRIIYEALVGPVSEGLELDHLCRVRCCVNPGHLEPVTRRENIRRGVNTTAEHMRKTRCPRGHEYDRVRIYRGSEHRHCSVCERDRSRRRTAARRSAA